MEDTTENNPENNEEEISSINERIIAFVKEHKVLFDKTMRAYKNNNTRNKLWAELGSELNMDVKSLTTRWRSLRDRFVKELKIADLCHRSGAEAIDEGDNWEFMEHMAFLKEHVAKRKTTANYDGPSTSEHTEFHDMVEEHLELDSQGTPSRTPTSRKRKGDEIDDKMSSLLDKFMANSSNADEKHATFGKLVACKLSKFPDHIADRVEAEILNVIYNAAENYRTETNNL
ncbi:uncharacterized protein LOC109428118 [Aedes albopictus]|uniref:MADF domain-containing protein n=1 Tax=Aedes albopictus TaxID=7160 RepID=A0ABM1XU28_AEDAL